MEDDSFKQKIKQGMIYATRLLMIAKRSEADIKSRLSDKGFPEEAISAVILRLKEQHYIDDAQLAKNYVQYSAPSKHLGRRRISLELRKKGVAREVVSEALELLKPAVERETASQIAMIRYQKLSTLDERVKKKRIYDFLIRQGFDFELCRSVVEELSGLNENN